MIKKSLKVQEMKSDLVWCKLFCQQAVGCIGDVQEIKNNLVWCKLFCQQAVGCIGDGRAEDNLSISLYTPVCLPHRPLPQYTKIQRQIQTQTKVIQIQMITSSQKLGRCASRQVRSVWKSLGRVSFGSKKFGPIFFIDFLAELDYSKKKHLTKNEH